MKVNSPEKIYVRVKDGKAFSIWNSEWVGVNDIEYVRADAFIEKACEWLENNLQGIVGGSIYIEDFKKYMKGE